MIWQFIIEIGPSARDVGGEEEENSRETETTRRKS